MKAQNTIGKLALIGLLIGGLLALTAAEPMNPPEDNLSEDFNTSQNESQGLIEGVTSWFQNLLNVDGNETANETNETNNTSVNESNITINESNMTEEGMEEGLQ